MISLKIAVNLPTCVGLLGVILTLVAYILLQTAKMDADHLGYGILNSLGSVLILWSLCFDWNLAAFIMESLWLVFSLYGLWRVMSKRRKQSTSR